MSGIPPEAVRSLIVTYLRVPLGNKGLKPEEVRDDFDLLTEGVVDSQGILELIVEIEGHFGVEINFDEMDPENLTIIGPFCRYVSEKSHGSGLGTYESAGITDLLLSTRLGQE